MADRPLDAPSSPEWVRAAIAQTREELESFVRTALSYSLHPRRFTREWLDGTRKALNPFGFALTAVGILGAIRAGSAPLLHAVEPSSGLADQLLSSILPSVYFVLLGAVTHAVLRLLGSRRALRDSLAVALYASGPSMAAQALADVVAVIYMWTFGRSINDTQIPVFTLVVVSVVLTTVPFVLALREVHGAARQAGLRAVFAFSVALVVTAFGFGALHPPGSYGIHPTILVKHTDGSVHFGFDVSD